MWHDECSYHINAAGNQSPPAPFIFNTNSEYVSTTLVSLSHTSFHTCMPIANLMGSSSSGHLSGISDEQQLALTKYWVASSCFYRFWQPLELGLWYHPTRRTRDTPNRLEYTRPDSESSEWSVIEACSDIDRTGDFMVSGNLFYPAPVILNTNSEYIFTDICIHFATLQFTCARLLRT